jgi:hypothetical protein
VSSPCGVDGGGRGRHRGGLLICLIKEAGVGSSYTKMLFCLLLALIDLVGDEFWKARSTAVLHWVSAGSDGIRSCAPIFWPYGFRRARHETSFSVDMCFESHGEVIGGELHDS